MNRSYKIALAVSLIAMITSCKTILDPKQTLSNKETRMQIMETIANDSSMSKEMMEAIMTNSNGMVMMQNHESMMKMMKDDPGVMQGMMSGMMEACKNDSNMMSGMCKTMMGNPQMMDMMQKMKGKNMEMGKMNAVDTTKAIDHKSHH